MNLILPLLPMVVIGIVLEVLSAAGIVPTYILPAPSAVVMSLLNDRAELMTGFQSTAFTAITGLALSFTVGIAVSMFLSISEVLRKAFLPYAVFFQTVPIIAIAPVLVIWFGFGSPTVIASAFIVSVFPMIANSIAGLHAIDPSLIDFFRLRQASRWQLLWKLRIPSAIPSMMTGLRVASGLAVIGAIVGEFVGGGGLGEVVDAARTQQRLDKVFAAVLLSSFLGLALVAVIDLLSRATLRSWRGRSEESR